MLRWRGGRGGTGRGRGRRRKRRRVACEDEDAEGAVQGNGLLQVHYVGVGDAGYVR